ncbi:MAG: FAD-dependent oxidoreductase [Kurthia sp.]|nr:FAD-dependent oxidoreductase [Candidatus Kurthia equi]
MQLYWTKINKIIDETSEVKTFLLDLPEGFTWEEGAHTHMGLKGFNAGEKPNKGLVRHMSISTLPSEKTVGITTRIKDQCSEFKAILKNMSVGDEVALFKIHSNVPLKRENKNLYLLSSGVGIATFRPIVKTYLENQDNVKSVHALNIDSSNDFLFTDIFTSDTEKNFTTQYVDSRAAYYAEAEKLAEDSEGIFYVIGSDEFIMQTIELLNKHDVKREQIVLDKRERFMEKFFSPSVTV